MFPGLFVTVPVDVFVSSQDWTYEYYCRIYGVSDFPSILGSMLPIDDPRLDFFNSSCFSNLSSKGQYVNQSTSPKSSVTIPSHALAINRTYQWMVSMANRRNASPPAKGYLHVRVDESLPYMVVVRCVISTLCTPNLEFQRINPTTQVALLSECPGNRSGLINITWNIYQGVNGSSTTIEWTLSNQISQKENIWFFGKRIFRRPLVRCSSAVLTYRTKYEQIHGDRSIVSCESFCHLLAFRSGLYLRLGDQFECIGLRPESATERRILLNHSPTRNYKHIVHRFVSSLVGRGWHQRLHDLW